MELTTEALGKIIGTNKRQPSGDPRRRRSPLLSSIHGDVRLLYSGTFSDPEPALISDLSTVGVGFIERRAMAVGEEFGLRIPRRDGTPMSLVCRVRRCQALKDGRYKIGATFARFDGESEGQELQVKNQAPQGADKRRARRVGHEKRVEIRFCRESGLSKPIAVTMQDFSARGVGLIHTEDLAAGEQFILDVRTKSGEIKQMLYTVARCRKTGSKQFLVGAEFTCIAPSAAA